MHQFSSLSFLIIECNARRRGQVRRSISTSGLGFHMIAEAVTATDALNLAAAIRVDVVILNPVVLDLPAPDFIRKLIHLARTKALTILLLQNRRSTPAAMEWNVCGTLKIPVTGQQLRELLLNRYQLPQLPPRTAAPITLCQLTSREQEVLKLVAEGKSSREIATALFVTTKTVVWHRQSIMKKLDLRSVAELTKYAVRHGLTTL